MIVRVLLIMGVLVGCSGPVTVAAHGHRATPSSTAVPTPSASVSPSVSSATRRIACSTRGAADDPFYNGPGSSAEYDQNFRTIPGRLPDLADHVPQGSVYWSHWNGTTAGIVLISAFAPAGGRADVYGYDPIVHKFLGVAQIADGHAGGLTIAGNWVYVSSGPTTLRKYDVSAIRSAIAAGAGHYTIVDPVGPAQELHGASFLATYGGRVFAGLYNGSARDTMSEYTVATDGHLTRGTSYQVPEGTQGVLVTATRFVFTASFGRETAGQIWVVKRGYHGRARLESTHVRCFVAPSNTEGITTDGATVWVDYESGESTFATSVRTRNVITHLHATSLSWLQGLVPG